MKAPPTLETVRERLRARAHNNRWTATVHSDPQVRRDAAVRADAYQTALLETELPE